MALSQKKRSRMGIALRIALLAWFVALATLLIFVLVTVPEQQKTFLRNLESKANGLAVSLHDVAAGAAVNEDFASVVSAAQTLLTGDPDLEFLIVMKNDGYSLIIEQNGWKVEPKLDSYWLNQERRPIGAIETVPLFNQRVFHFAQPFDYSGIQWGWIHVGLSLKGYDESVNALYRSTLLLALGCIGFSLLVSLLYAKHMVQPILRLRHVVERIASGDLSVRADKNRHDELGSLAESVNIMAEALLRRDLILESVRFAAQQFLRTSQWEEAIDEVLSRIGRAANSSRAYVFKNHLDEFDRLCASQQHEWTAPGFNTMVENPKLQSLPYLESGFGRWIAHLEKNEIISGPVSKMSLTEKVLLESENVHSIIVAPIFVDGIWWGFLGLDDCIQDRTWTDAEKDTLFAAADMIGATIARQRVQEALLEAKSTLEHRVDERTRELQDQVTAKEKALSELAEVQSSLVELSRAAGMAEVATGVLHNVGNVLNSINVSCTLIMDQLRESRIANVSKVAELLAQAEGELSLFLTQDPRGKQIPGYLTSLADALKAERQVMLKEAESLNGRIGHIKEIVAMQQSYGRVSGVNETIFPEQLMEDAVKLNSGALARHGIKINRQYQSVPPIVVDKHKVLQILLNLINNAKHACSEGGAEEKIITLRIHKNDQDRLCMEVEDNGMGIPLENMTRIFQHGFTTRRSGHGFGLHSGAIAAHEMGGALSVQSDGPGRGALFTLELPCRNGGAR
jgi:two-component system, NtrC family, sensor kinase